MIVSIELAEDAHERLEAEAFRRGISIDRLVAEFAAALPGASATEPESAARTRPAFIGLGSSTSGRFARHADQILGESFGRD